MITIITVEPKTGVIKQIVNTGKKRELFQKKEKDITLKYICGGEGIVFLE